MRRVIKNLNSEIINKALVYKKDSSINNKKIAEILLKEQFGFCAYTEEPITRIDAKDVEHFNPTLKYSKNDSYQNWFVVKHQINKEKSEKWSEFQPVLHPTNENFEDRIKYYDGDYFAEDTDEAASNLIKLLKLDDLALADKRKKYLKRKREEIKTFGISNLEFFQTLLNADPVLVSYPRAIKEEFGIDIIEQMNTL